jgi:hypothetical protein
LVLFINSIASLSVNRLSLLALIIDLFAINNSSLQLPNIESAFMDDSILVHANNWLQMKTWRNAVKQSEEPDYQETYELIALLKEYWSDLVGNYGDIYSIPLIGGFVQKLEEDFILRSSLTDHGSTDSLS